jgi:uncharacterized Zn-binding protein involved in type VI secretion
MSTACRQSDMSMNPADAHGCNGCPHCVSGPAMSGSGNVMIEGMPALRAQGVDMGVHAACCGPNSWVTMQGSATVYINDMPVVRLGDMTVHCGGVGSMISSCATVNVGG